MICNRLLAVGAIAAGLLELALANGRLGSRSTNLLRRANDDTPSTCLSPQAIQTASFSDGQGQNDKGVKAGQAKAETWVISMCSLPGLSHVCDRSKNNFIDVCDGQTLTNGVQNLDGSCNPIRGFSRSND